jgi:hypothetical protein
VNVRHPRPPPHTLAFQAQELGTFIESPKQPLVLDTVGHVDLQWKAGLADPRTNADQVCLWVTRTHTETDTHTNTQTTRQTHTKKDKETEMKSYRETHRQTRNEGSDKMGNLITAKRHSTFTNEQHTRHPRHNGTTTTKTTTTTTTTTARARTTSATIAGTTTTVAPAATRTTPTTTTTTTYT